MKNIGLRFFAKIVFSILVITLVGYSTTKKVLAAERAHLSLPLPALNIELIGSNFDLSTGLTTQRASPSIAYNDIDHEYMVVWFDLQNLNTTGNDIFGQRVSETGILLGSNFPIIEFSDSQSDPRVAYNSVDNEYLVAWKTQQPGFFNDVRGRRVSNTGIILSDDFFILGDDPLGGGGGGNEFSMTYNPTANEYLVTGRGRGVRGRRVANTGNLLGDSEIIIEPFIPGIPAPNGQVVYNPTTDQYFATWRDQAEIARNLKGRHISASGALTEDVVIISPLFPDSGQAASAAFDPVNDRYLIVFKVFQENEILGQFISSAGNLIGDNFPVATSLATQSYPSIAFSSIDNAFVVVWREENDIVVQLLSDDGSAIGFPHVITRDTAWASRNPAIAYNVQTGEFLVAWSDERNLSRGEIDIFAQLIGITSRDSVQIDIKPGSTPNSINPHSKGVIPVAILTTSIADGDTSDFDATQVDPTTVHFGLGGADEVHSIGHLTDVDRDGDMDLLFHFRTEDSSIVCGDTHASLTGETFSGLGFSGADLIRTVECKK